MINLWLGTYTVEKCAACANTYVVHEYFRTVHLWHAGQSDITAQHSVTSSKEMWIVLPPPTTHTLFIPVQPKALVSLLPVTQSNFYVHPLFSPVSSLFFYSSLHYFASGIKQQWNAFSFMSHSVFLFVFFTFKLFLFVQMVVICLLQKRSFRSLFHLCSFLRWDFLYVRWTGEKAKNYQENLYR